MIGKIDHIGMVVKDTAKTAASLHTVLGYKETTVHKEPLGGFTSTILSNGASTFELIEPSTAEGPLAKFLEKHGDGIHHVSFQVDDINKEVVELKAKGVQLLSNEPQQVSDKVKSIFIHPRSTSGILIELMQYL